MPAPHRAGNSRCSTTIKMTEKVIMNGSEEKRNVGVDRNLRRCGGTHSSSHLSIDKTPIDGDSSRISELTPSKTQVSLRVVLSVVDRSLKYRE